MKLRHSPGSPFVRKVMVVAYEHGLVDRLELVATTVSPIQPNDGLAPENPLMKIPSLTTDDGQVIFDSPVICEYLDTLSSGHKLFPSPGAARWTALRQQALGDGILDALILGRYEKAMRPADKQWSGWVEAQMRKARGGLAALEGEELAGPGVAGAGVAGSGLSTIGLVTIACVLGYLDFRFPDDGWRGRHPKLAGWYEGVATLPSMTATKPPVA